MLEKKTFASLKVLLVAVKYPHGSSAGGDSYEWNHIYCGLKNRVSELRFFDFLSSFISDGKEVMQKKLQEEISEFKPDVIIFFPHQDEFDCKFLEELKRKTNTLCFYQDANWRFDLALRLSPFFNAYTVSDLLTLRKLSESGLTHGRLLAFGVNDDLFCENKEIRKDIDVSFVGAWHPHREWLLKSLSKAGVNVAIYGYGWPAGPLPTTELIKVIQRSKISLNLSNSISYDLRYLLSSARAFINTFRSKKNIEQIKGRHFEIPSCHTMQLSYYVNGLEDSFEICKEIAIYTDKSDLVDKVKYYLHHDQLRQDIARNGHNRVLSTHTYFQRFQTLFQNLGWCV